MQTIKNFIYLDEYKMYSISSQIFEGITEYLIDYQGSTKEDLEMQKGPIPVVSGRIMADILKSESGTQEKKYLHDYSYTLFEDRLRELGKIFSLSTDNIDETIEKIDNTGFVEIRGKVIFNDMNILKSTMEGFNELGEALAYITNFSQMEEVRQQSEKIVEGTKDRNQKAKLRQKLKSGIDIKKLAKDQGLNMDNKFLEKLTFALNYGFQDQFAVQMPMGQYTFSADCKRDAFREKEDSLMRKYSRFAEKEFVLVGTITQSSSASISKRKSEGDGDYSESKEKNEGDGDYSEPQHLKEAVMNLVEALSEVESEFSGKLANEIIVDPIAIYREI